MGYGQANRKPPLRKTVTVMTLEDLNGMRKLHCNDGNVYLISRKKTDVGLVFPNKTYDILYDEVNDTYNNVPRVSRWINGVLEVADSGELMNPPAQAKQAAPSNGAKYSEDDRKSFLRKDVWMAKMNAHTNSTAMACALLEYLSKMPADEFKSTEDVVSFVDKEKARWYAEIISETTKEEEGGA